MPRPRFFKLSEERRHSILERASDEFVEHGYQGASLNRLLEAAELSKGSFYYYFDDRDDLFGAVLEHEMVFKGIPKKLLEVTTAEEFWVGLEEWVESLYSQFLSSPRAMALLRELAKIYGTQQMPEAVIRMIEAMHGELGGMLSVGKNVGAVRSDLPDDLLVALVMKLGEAIDFWTAEHLDQVAQKSPAEMRAMSVELFQRLLRP